MIFIAIGVAALGVAVGWALRGYYNPPGTFEFYTADDWEDELFDDYSDDEDEEYEL